MLSNLSFSRSWHLLHTPLSTLRLVTHFLPASVKIPDPDTPTLSRPTSPPSRGTLDYYVMSLGGHSEVAQLYLEAGLSHLEGNAQRLLSSSYSPLSSIRTPEPQNTNQFESGTQMWKRDREYARKYFDRARQLAPSLDVPYLPSETDLRGHDRHHGPSPLSHEDQSLQMPLLDVEQDKTIRPDDGPPLMDPKSGATVRLRRRRQQASEALLEQADNDEDNPWYITGLIGAGTALLVVSVVGALSFQTWRKNQS